MSTPKDPKDDDEIEEEIEENLSIEESSSLAEANEELKKLEKIANRKRQLFDFDDENVNQLSGSSRFKNLDDSQLEDALSGSGLAQHFKPTEFSDDGDNEANDDDDDDDNDGDEVDDDATQMSSSKIDESKKTSIDDGDDYEDREEQTRNSSNEIDSLDEVLNELDSLPIEGSGDKKEIGVEQLAVKVDENPSKNRDQSPDDIILLNDKRVSINSLKHLQHTSQETSWNNQSTANDISDIVRDDMTASLKRDLMMRKSKSHDVAGFPSTSSAVNRTFRSLDVPFEHFEDDEDVEEEAFHQTNLTDNLINAGELSELDPQIDINNESEMEKLLQDVSSTKDVDIVDEVVEEIIDESEDAKNSLTENSGDDDILNLKEKINSLSNSKSIKEVSSEKKDEVVEIQSRGEQVEEAIDADRPTIKPMEKLEHCKEVLDDITEESEPPLESLTIESVAVKQVLDVTTFVNLEKDSSTETTTTTATTTATTQSSLTEKGQEIRMMLQQHIADYNDIPPDDIPAEIPSLTGMGSSGGGGNGNGSSDFDSVVSLNMFHMMENKVKDLNEIIAGKDVCLAALNMQLDAYSRRESLKENRDSSLKELPSSGRASSSLATNSTEYRTIQDENVTKFFDFQNELNERDHLIEQLTESLQQSIQMREQLQTQGEKLTTEVIQLRKQLTETMEFIKKPHWMARDQESTGQRISEISIDLVSETDEESERNFGVDAEQTANRNSLDRQLDEFYDQQLFPSLSKQVEQFLKFLSPEEMRIFNMVQKKFDDYLNQEIETLKVKHDDEMKIMTDRFESEKVEKDVEVGRLRQLLSSVKSGSSEVVELRKELEARHSQEMEDLRTYFEKKCSEMEKQYSEEIFSQHSRRHSNDTGSELSDQDNLQDDPESHRSPLRKTNADIFASPTHRKITPTSIGPVSRSVRRKTGSLSLRSIGPMDGDSERDKEDARHLDEIKSFYQEKIKEMNRSYEEKIKGLQMRLKRFETGDADDEFITVIAESGGDTITNPPTPPLPPPTPPHDVEHDFNKIISDYERRLQEQVALARQDVVNELDIQIKALLSENQSEDSRWPPELILLREKFTARSQLEIAQLQIKHEEEMARVKSDYEKQLARKIKRQSTFDSSRDLDQIVIERDNLRELSNTLRWLLCELAKYCSVCEDDLNKTFIEELQKHGVNPHNLDESNLSEENYDNNTSALSNISNKSLQPRRTRFTADVSSILSIIEEPSLIEYISSNRTRRSSSDNSRINLDECLERLKNEALCLLRLSEDITKQVTNGDHKLSDKDDSCEEEDGLKKSATAKVEKLGRAKSFNESLLQNGSHNRSYDSRATRSLPIFSPPNLSKEELLEFDEKCEQSGGELNIRLHELKNRLLKSEDEKRSLEHELAEIISRHDSLAGELQSAKEQIESLENQRETYMESFGANIVSPRHEAKIPKTTSLIQLQERAKGLLNQSHQSIGDNTNLLLQLVEDFCREGDRFMEEGKKDKDDLQSQITAADKQLKATRSFLEEQAAEREQERDDFLKEIERLKNQLREREKEKNSYDRVTKEVEMMENQLKEMAVLVSDYEEKKSRLEDDLKASIDKIYVLREIITDLESQVEAKTVNEHVLRSKIDDLNQFITGQTRANESLQQEVDSLKIEVGGQGYGEKIADLEEKLRRSVNSAEQSMALEQMTEQLREIETTLDRKTKTLESLHSDICSASCSSPSEDVSVKGSAGGVLTPPKSTSPRGSPPSIPIDEVARILEKMAKHTRAEEAAMKRIKDLEMQVGGVRQSYAELQQERDILQEKLTEQMMKITSLQSRLDEQRHRAEEVHRQGTSDLNIRVHDLQSEITTLRETISSQTKQIATLKSHLEESKKLIDRQEAELTQIGPSTQSDRYEAEIRSKTEEIQRLKEKIKNEMINKLALPDLMETMLADKNDEIDHLKEQLNTKDKELKLYLDLNLDENHIRQLQKTAKELMEGKASARTLSDIVSISSELDEPDVERRCVAEISNEPFHFNIPHGDMVAGQLDTHPYKRSTNEMTMIGVNPNNVLSGITQSGFFSDMSHSFPKDSGSMSTPQLEPRKINFSLINTTGSIEKMKIQSSPFIQEITDDRQLSDIFEEDQQPTDVDGLKDMVHSLKEKLKILPHLENEVESLKLSLETVATEKNQTIDELRANLRGKVDELTNLQVELSAQHKLYDDLMDEKKEIQGELDEMKMELMRMEKDVKGKENEIKSYLIKIEELEEELTSVHQKSTTAGGSNDLQYQLETFRQQIESLNKTILHKDDVISKFEKDVMDFVGSEKLNIERIKNLEAKIWQLEANQMASDREYDSLHNSNELISVGIMRNQLNHLNEELEESRRDLSNKMIEYERVKLDLEEKDDEIEKLKIVIQATATGSGSNNLQTKLFEEIDKNKKLSAEIEKLRRDFDRVENSSSPKPFSFDEIAKQVENELNYSAQLDSSILKVIESDEVASDDDEAHESTEKKKVNELLRQTGSIDHDFKELKFNLECEINKRRELTKINAELSQEIESFRHKLELEQLNVAKLQSLLETEKRNSSSIQQQDANVIEAMRSRLEAAIESESDLQKKLDEERSRSEKISSQLLTTGASTIPPASPRSLFLPVVESPKRGAMDREDISRLETELLFLTAQNERERERTMDLQRVLDRERHRFDKEVSERKEFGEKMKKEVDRVLLEKEVLQKELNHLQEKYEMANREIENLETRVEFISGGDLSGLGFDRHEHSDLRKTREKLHEVEKEKERLNETIYLLRCDIERGAQREAKLAEALAKEASGDGPVPQLFLQKLRDTNDMLAENARENRQMADTLQFLTEERRALQNRVLELESGMGIVSSPLDELQERANHLFGKYLKSESCRKALVYQKRYLQILISGYEKNEAVALALIHGKAKDKKRKSFRSVVHVVIAIQRMKFIVKRWHTTNRHGTKAIFSSQHGLPRRSASATTNNWARGTDPSTNSNSPPCRDRPPYFMPKASGSSSNSTGNQSRPLQSPAIISDQHHHHHHHHKIGLLSSRRHD